MLSDNFVLTCFYLHACDECNTYLFCRRSVIKQMVLNSNRISSQSIGEGLTVKLKMFELTRKKKSASEYEY